MARYRGKHRKPTSTRHTIARSAVVGAVVATPIVLACPAGAAGADWDTLARCESSGNWAANTGNGFFGGLQFTPQTWAAYGGTKYADSAAGASREQQIEVAERVLAAQGPGAWPVCSVKTGFLSGGSGGTPAGGDSTTSPGDNSTTPPGDNGTGSSEDNGAASTGDNSTPSPGDSTPSGESMDRSAGNQPATMAGAAYTVRPGDTLSGIGAQFRVDWHTIYQRNATAVHDPNLIFPGQQLILR